MSNGDSHTSHLTFSQLYRYEDLPQPMKLEELSDDLRREIWNEIRRFLLDKSIPGTFEGYYFSPKCYVFIERVIGEIKGIPHSEVDTKYELVLRFFESFVQNARFNQIFDLIKFIVNDPYASEDLVESLANLFEKHQAAYRLDLSQSPYWFYPCSNKEQGEATQQAMETLREAGMDNVVSHLRQAAGHINAGQHKDSIVDSIHAVVSAARQIAPQAKKTLGPALNALEKEGLLTNGQLKAGFEKLYAYTNSEEGIRHPMVSDDASEVSSDESIFMFGVCASFAAYLVNKKNKLKANDQT